MSNWIKMSVGLRTHPKVVRMASALKADRLRVIGALHAVWSIFDAHTEEGILDGYTHQAIDDDLGWKGFAKAMQDVGWLLFDDAGAHVPGYSEHNGATAKRRAMEASRKGSVRKKSASNAPASPQDGGTQSGQASASDADKMRNREEKRREDILTTAVDDSSIPACAQPPAGGETKPPDPAMLARIAVECARVKIQGLTPEIIERWAGKGATHSLVSRAIADAAISWTKTGGKGDIPSGYVSTTLERIMSDEAKARAIVARREAATRETIAEIQAASATAVPPPADLIEAQRKAARQ